MLVIRDEQLEIMGNEAMSSFRRDLADRLMVKGPPELRSRPPAEIDEWVGRSVALAERYGIEDELAITRFVELGAEIGSDFEAELEEAGPAGILSDQTIPAAARVELLFIELLGELPSE